MWFTLSCEVDASDSDIAKARRDPPLQEYAAQEGRVFRMSPWKILVDTGAA
jgi:hypothetical protein